MKIAGIGTDLVEVDRIQRILDRHGDRLARRVLSPNELEQWSRSHCPARYLAKRFATKEACAKALGTGIAGGLRWQDIETEHDAAGRPWLRFHGEAQRLCERRGVSGSHLSVSDERQYAIAFVILMGD
jgi:holo-[acyl-carrier protein] synthase